jgi:hypothetical protein
MTLTKKEKIERIDAVIKVLDNYTHYDSAMFVKCGSELNKQYWVCYVYSSLYDDSDIEKDIPEVELIKNDTNENTWLTDSVFHADPLFLEEHEVKKSLFLKTIALEFLKLLL